MKKFNELKEMFEGNFVTAEQFEEIAENENVTSVIDNGESGQHIGHTWYTAYSNSDEFDFYTN
jgi:hypothetical protein